MIKFSGIKKRYFILWGVLAILGFLTFMFTGHEVRYFCQIDKCVSVVHFTKGREFYFRVYDSRIYTRFFLDSLNYAEYPIDDGVMIGKHLENGKIVVSSDNVIPTIKGNLANNLVFKNTGYYEKSDKFELSQLPAWYI